MSDPVCCVDGTTNGDDAVYDSNRTHDKSRHGRFDRHKGKPANAQYNVPHDMADGKISEYLTNVTGC